MSEQLVSLFSISTPRTTRWAFRWLRDPRNPFEDPPDLWIERVMHNVPRNHNHVTPDRNYQVWADLCCVLCVVLCVSSTSIERDVLPQSATTLTPIFSKNPVFSALFVRVVALTSLKRPLSINTLHTWPATNPLPPVTQALGFGGFSAFLSLSSHVSQRECHSQWIDSTLSLTSLNWIVHLSLSLSLFSLSLCLSVSLSLKILCVLWKRFSDLKSNGGHKNFTLFPSLSSYTYTEHLDTLHSHFYMILLFIVIYFV